MSVAIITAEIKEGATLKQVCDDMMDLASQLMCNVKFTFEGVEMVINENQLPEDISKEWKLRKEMHDKFLTTKEKESGKGEKSLYQYYRDDRGYPDIDPINNVI